MNTNNNEKIDEIVKIIKDNLSDEEDKDFIDNLKYFATLTEVPEDVNGKFNEIVEFVKNELKKQGIIAEASEIGKYFGHIISKENINKENINKKDTLLIADLKVKSMVFLLRAYNLVGTYNKYTTKKSEQDIQNDFSSFKEEVKSILEELKILKNKQENSFIYDVISKKENGEEMYESRWHCKCEELIKKLNDESLEEKNIIDVFSNAMSDCEMEYIRDVTILYMFMYDKIDIEKLFEKEPIRLLYTITNIYKDAKDENFKKIAHKSEKIIEKYEENTNSFKNNIYPIRYFLFDNRMKEVQYYGISNRFNWFWEQEKNVTLFRNFSKDRGSKEDLKEKKNVEYFKNLMKHIKEHVNGTNVNKAYSYSRNPIRDLYKYLHRKSYNYYCNYSQLVFECDSISVNNNDEINIENLELNEDKSVAVFEIVEGVTVNSLKIKKDNNKKEIFFYEYLKEEADNYESTLFCIEFCKENAIVSEKSGRRLKHLNDYLNSWTGDYTDFIYSKISENDDEVITSPEYFDEVKKIYNMENNDEKINEDFVLEPNVRYQVDLNILEIMQLYYYLLLKHKEKYSAEFQENELKGSLKGSLKAKLKDKLFKEMNKKIINNINKYENEYCSCNLGNIQGVNEAKVLNKVKDMMVEKIIEKITETKSSKKIKFVGEKVWEVDSSDKYKGYIPNDFKVYSGEDKLLNEIRKIFISLY